MAILPLYIFRLDLQPYYRVKVENSDKTLVDLTGSSIVCSMKENSTGVLKINRQSSGMVLLNQTTNKGEFEYHWQTSETDTVGNYSIEFEVTPQSGGKFTVPPAGQGRAVVVIESSLDSL